MIQPLYSLCTQGIITHVTDVKPLATVMVYIDYESGNEIYQEVRVALLPGFLHLNPLQIQKVGSCLLGTAGVKLLPSLGTHCYLLLQLGRSHTSDPAPRLSLCLLQVTGRTFTPLEAQPAFANYKASPSVSQGTGSGH